ncbi:MAG: peptide-methionine (S)-S-oxide reductase MsrA [Syntrophothermus sp.]
MKNLLIVFIFLSIGLGCTEVKNAKANEVKMDDNKKYELATFGSGCFWCTEAIFQRVDGVVKVESGYSGGNVVNPTYEAVCTGKTGHAEVTQISYDPEKVSYTELLEIFWKTHDPTTLNKQGADVGTQYRSAIFYHNDEQKQLAEKYKAELTKAHIWENPIVTEIVPFKKFYKAEDYHQNYYNQNTNQGYCSFVITPKLEKFKKVFADKLKKE